VDIGYDALTRLNGCRTRIDTTRTGQGYVGHRRRWRRI